MQPIEREIKCIGNDTKHPSKASVLTDANLDAKLVFLILFIRE